MQPLCCHPEQFRLALCRAPSCILRQWLRLRIANIDPEGRLAVIEVSFFILLGCQLEI
jgi:hypothetical protein